MTTSLSFPTALHREVVEQIARFFAGYSQVDTLLVVNSCARGKATPSSDLDVAVLVTPTTTAELLRLESLWLESAEHDPSVIRFKQSGPYAKVHLDVLTGEFIPAIWDDGGGPDSFEIEIGNRIAHGAPFGDPGPYFGRLQSTWLPYYEDALRLSRLEMVQNWCRYDLDHVPHFVERGLYFQAFDRLYKAFQEFLQAVFIARRTYPIAYNKWIHEQVVEWLGLPDLYRELPGILTISQFESTELVQRADQLRALLETWTIN
jgi:predicted nucleotidyltransferase